ncbi:MAG: hypothetical protein ACE5FT_02650 [Candidatus Nanoarchaeia archaeon]
MKRTRARSAKRRKSSKKRAGRKRKAPISSPRRVRRHSDIIIGSGRRLIAIDVKSFKNKNKAFISNSRVDFKANSEKIKSLRKKIVKLI